MYTFLVILIVIIAVLLTLLVLVQNSKGGGLASSFSSGNQVMGVRKTTDFLEKATWSLVAAMALLSIITVGFNSSRNANSADEIIGSQIENIESSQAPVEQGFEEVPAETAAEAE